MKNDFIIQIPEFDEKDSKIFGVFSDKVIPPSGYTCIKNDKMFSRFFYVVHGEIVFNKGTNEIVSAPAGSIVYLPNDITYQSEWVGNEIGEFISVNFILDEFYVRLPNKICIAAMDKNGLYLEMFSRAYNIWLGGRPGYKLETLAEIYKILYTLFTDSTYRQIKTKHHTIYKGILYLENHYLEEVDVATLANMCSTSESNFRRLFKEYKKMSPVTYRNYLRIKKSTELLRTGEYSIAEAATAVNIPDVCRFYKLFKQFFNTTPKQFIP